MPGVIIIPLVWLEISPFLFYVTVSQENQWFLSEIESLGNRDGGCPVDIPFHRVCILAPARNAQGLVRLVKGRAPPRGTERFVKGGGTVVSMGDIMKTS